MAFNTCTVLDALLFLFKRMAVGRQILYSDNKKTYLNMILHLLIETYHQYQFHHVSSFVLISQSFILTVLESYTKHRFQIAASNFSI